jgi:glycosyltransferase involved in cell wall biosynthesis
MSVSVVMPTVGRPSLWAAVASVVDQLEDDDELIVVGDGRQGAAASVVEDFQPARLTYVEASAPGSAFGNAQRDAGMAIANGSHLMFLDDDDAWRHGALERVRDALQCHCDANAHIFKAEWGPGHHAHGVTLWADEEVRVQNIATPMVVLPNRCYARSWMDGNAAGVVSDWWFLSTAIGECAGVVWHTDVIATVRP